MALDANLLAYELRTVDGVTQLHASTAEGAAEAAPALRYRRSAPPGYRAQLLDGLADTALAAITAESSAAEGKSIRLYRPDRSIALRRRAPSLHHDWRFVWDGCACTNSQTYQWRKELRVAAAPAYACTAIRTSDPDIACVCG